MADEGDLTAEIKLAFAALDQDGDKTLSKSEIAELIRNLSNQSPSQVQIQRLFDVRVPYFLRNRVCLPNDNCIVFCSFVTDVVARRLFVCLFCSLTRIVLLLLLPRFSGSKLRSREKFLWINWYVKSDNGSETDHLTEVEVQGVHILYVKEGPFKTAFENFSWIFCPDR